MRRTVLSILIMVVSEVRERRKMMMKLVRREIASERSHCVSKKLVYDADVAYLASSAYGLCFL